MYDDFAFDETKTGLARSVFPHRTVQHCKNALSVIGASLLAGLVATAAVSLVSPNAFSASPAQGSASPAIASPATPTPAAPAVLQSSGDLTAGLFFRSGRPDALLEAPTLASEVLMEVSGQVTRVTLRQRFQNTSKAWQEGIYVFPLPERSAVDRLVMTIGERRVEGRILEREEARRVYEEAAQNGQHAGLVESERPNVFVTSVANVGPGEEVAIEIQYQDRVAYADGRFSLRFPMVVAPRYTPLPNALPSVTYPGPDQDTPQPPSPYGQPKVQPISDDGSLRLGTSPTAGEARDLFGHVEGRDLFGHVEGRDLFGRVEGRDLFGPVRHPDQGLANPVALLVTLNAGRPLSRLESLYHEVAVDEADGTQTITLVEGNVPADRDFVLEWAYVESVTPEAALFAEGRDGDSYLLIDVFPPDNATLPETTLPRTVIPRDLIFVVDTSGSMHGPSMEQAKFALRQAIERLGPQDRFNIIQFNDQTSVLFPGLQPVTPETVGRAKAAVRRLNADGGTEMLPALQLALEGQAAGSQSGASRLPQVVFLTDGAVGNEHQLFQEIAAKLGATRLFTVGIGSAPNSYFMRKAAEVGHGSFTYIGDVAEVAERMEALFRKLERPVLTDLTLDWSDSAVGSVELYPSTLPDIYAGEPIEIAARIPDLAPDALTGSLRLRGRVLDQAWERELRLQDLSSAPGVAAIWARDKFEQVEDGVYRGEDYDAVRKAALTVALDYQLVTHLTSLVAVDDKVVRPEGEALEQSEIPRNLPEGWDHGKVFGEAAPSMPHTMPHTMPLRALPAPLMRQANAGSGEAFALPMGATSAGLMALIGLGLICLAGFLMLVAARIQRAVNQITLNRTGVAA